MNTEELIKLAESCGLTHCGELENGEPQFIGDDAAWDRFQTAQEDYEDFLLDYEDSKIKNFID